MWQSFPELFPPPLTTASRLRAAAGAMAELKRSGSMSAFWRALALPLWRGGGGGGAGGGGARGDGGGSGRAPRGSLDELGPSCSLGAEAAWPDTPSPRSGSSGDEAPAECGPEAAAAECCSGAAHAAVLPPVPPLADARPRRGGKRPPVVLNARGSEAALRSTNPIRKARWRRGGRARVLSHAERRAPRPRAPPHASPHAPRAPPPGGGRRG